MRRQPALWARRRREQVSGCESKSLSSASMLSPSTRGGSEMLVLEEEKKWEDEGKEEKWEWE